MKLYIYLWFLLKFLYTKISHNVIMLKKSILYLVRVFLNGINSFLKAKRVPKMTSVQVELFLFHFSSDNSDQNQRNCVCRSSYEQLDDGWDYKQKSFTWRIKDEETYYLKVFFQCESEFVKTRCGKISRESCTKTTHLPITDCVWSVI